MSYRFWRAAHAAILDFHVGVVKRAGGTRPKRLKLSDAVKKKGVGGLQGAVHKYLVGRRDGNRLCRTGAQPNNSDGQGLVLRLQRQ